MMTRRSQPVPALQKQPPPARRCRACRPADAPSRRGKRAPLPGRQPIPAGSCDAARDETISSSPAARRPRRKRRCRYAGKAPRNHGRSLARLSRWTLALRIITRPRRSTGVERVRHGSRTERSHRGERPVSRARRPRSGWVCRLARGWRRSASEEVCSTPMTTCLPRRSPANGTATTPGGRRFEKTRCSPVIETGEAAARLVQRNTKDTAAIGFDQASCPIQQPAYRVRSASTTRMTPAT